MNIGQIWSKYLNSMSSEEKQLKKQEIADMRRRRSAYTTDEIAEYMVFIASVGESVPDMPEVDEWML